MSLKKLAGETLIYGLGSVLGRLLNFILLVPFVTRVLSAEGYGVVSDLFFYIAFFIAFLVFRLDTAVFRFANRSEFSARVVGRQAQQFVWGMVILICGGGLLIAPTLAEWMLYPDRIIYVQLFLLIVAFDALAAIPLAQLRLEQRAWMFAMVNLVNIFLNLGLVYLFLYYIPNWKASGSGFFEWWSEQWQIAYYFGATLAAGVMRYLLLLGDRVLRNRRQAANSPDAADDPARRGPGLRVMLRYAAPLVVVALAGIINSLIGPSFLRRFFSDNLELNEYWAGQYGAAMKLAVFLNLFITAYNYAAEPFFFRRAGNDLSKADKGIYADATRAFAWIGSLAVAALLLLEPLARRYLGEGLREGLDILPILLAANLLLGLYYNFAIAYKLTDRTMLGGAIALLGSAIVLGGNFLFVPRFGIYATAWASLVCFLVMCSLAYAVSRRYFPVPYALGRFALYFLLTAGVAYLGGKWESLWLRTGLLVVFSGVMVALEWKWLRRII